MSTLTHRKSLNEKQLDILRLLYRFRFGTTELLALALGIKSKHKMNERLKILLDREYIGRNYESEYRLLRKHASYYLLPKGIKALRASDDKYDESVLHNLHKDKSASEQFIQLNLQVLKAYCDVASGHSNCKFFTKSQLSQFDYFPEPLPDAYIRINEGRQEEQYFVEILQSFRPFFVAVRKVRKYLTYAEDGEWDVTGTNLPCVLLICDDQTLKKRVGKLLVKLEGEREDELHYGVGLDIGSALLDE
jgi:uncharacterized cysteine cluster protein YcgN (CxxCxxCC family)